MRNESQGQINNTVVAENKKGVWFVMKLISPKSTVEDRRRREFILNILLISSVVLSGIAFIVKLTYNLAMNVSASGISSTIALFIMFFIFFLLYFLSRKGSFIVAAYIFIGIYFIAAAYTAYNWGIYLPQSLLLDTLIIIMAGILISTRFSFFITSAISLIIIIINYFQVSGRISPDLSWKQESPLVGDAIIFAITFGVIAVVSWLSNREIEKSLFRARNSEMALKQERDLLEIKVEERTKELKRAQLEKISQLYHFAEFGRLASGLFHDLVNPLTVVSFNLEELNERAKEKRSQALMDIASILQQAIDGTRRMQIFVESVRKQIQQQETMTIFSVENEINQVIQLLSFKAKEQGVRLVFSPTCSVSTYGDSVKMYKVISNLVSNAIDAYDGIGDTHESGLKRDIVITLLEKDGMVTVRAQDWGKGVSKEIASKIFEPFFTTKSIDKGTGLGLSICKNIIENDFSGHIYVKSKPKQGTIFTFEFPLRKNV